MIDVWHAMVSFNYIMEIFPNLDVPYHELVGNGPSSPNIALSPCSCYPL